MLPEEDPSPATYHIPRQPLNEKNSPMFTIGKRCFNEKGGGGRTSWEKEWFNSKNPYIIKSDFRRELFWPTPANYRIKSTIGVDSNKAVFYQYPVHSIANRQSADRNNQFFSTGISQDHCVNCKTTQNIVLSRDDLIEKENYKRSNAIKDLSMADVYSSRDLLELDVAQSADFVSVSAPKVFFLHILNKYIKKFQ